MAEIKYETTKTDEKLVNKINIIKALNINTSRSTRDADILKAIKHNSDNKTELIDARHGKTRIDDIYLTFRIDEEDFLWAFVCSDSYILKIEDARNAIDEEIFKEYKEIQDSKVQIKDFSTMTLEQYKNYYEKINIDDVLTYIEKHKED